MKLVPVKDYPNLARDIDTGSIVNLDDRSYADYKRKKKNRLVAEEEKKLNALKINNLEMKIEGLEKDIKQILDILKNVNNSR